MANHTRRVSKALRMLKGEGVVKVAKYIHVNLMWSLVGR